MERWHGRVAVVTGASSGIGAAIACDLAKAGMVVVACARRLDRLNQLREQLSSVKERSNFHPYKCDVSDEKSVKELFDSVEKKLGGVDVLVNNAGVLRSSQLLDENNSADVRATVDTNILGVVYCTREAYRIMRSHNINDGHMVFINSICGHHTLNMGSDFPSFNIYSATKHALTSMVEAYRQDFLRLNTKIRVTSISPGGVNTEIFPNDMEVIMQGQMPMLNSEDVSNAVLYAIGTPAHVQIHELTIKPVGELV